MMAQGVQRFSDFSSRRLVPDLSRAGHRGHGAAPAVRLVLGDLFVEEAVVVLADQLIQSSRRSRQAVACHCASVRAAPPPAWDSVNRKCGMHSPPAVT